MGRAIGQGMTWSDEESARLVSMRDVERVSFKEIARELRKPLAACANRYYRIVAQRAPSIVPEPKVCAPILPHQELGIDTYEHLQATTDYNGGIDKDTGQYYSPHLYRERITLPKVIR